MKTWKDQLATIGLLIIGFGFLGIAIFAFLERNEQAVSAIGISLLSFSLVNVSKQLWQLKASLTPKSDSHIVK